MPFIVLVTGLILSASPALASFAFQEGDSCSQARSAFSASDYDLAESLLLRCISERPDELPPYLNLCAFYQQRGRVEDLVRAARHGIERFPAEPGFYLTVGNAAGRRGDLDEAVSVFAGAVERFPGEARFTEGLTRSLVLRGMRALDSGRYEEAHDDLERAVQLQPAHLDALVNLGRALHNLFRSREALEIFDRVAARAPDVPLLQFHRGVVLQELGRFAEAIEALDRQIAVTPDHGFSFHFRGVSRRSTGDYQEALRDLERAVEIMPDFGQAHYERARCLRQLGRDMEAEAAFRRAVALTDSDPRPAYGLARLLFEEGRREEAAEIMASVEEDYLRMIAEDRRRFLFRTNGAEEP